MINHKNTESQGFVGKKGSFITDVQPEAPARHQVMVDKLLGACYIACKFGMGN